MTFITVYCWFAAIIFSSKSPQALFLHMPTALTTLDDETLVRQSQAELPYNATSYEELVKRYQKPVYAMCRRYLSIDSDAEDATQEVFMKVFHTLPNFEYRSTFKTWLFSIAINHCKTLLSKTKRFNQFHEYGDDDSAESYEDEGNDTAMNIEDDDERNCVQSVIGKMKDDERDFILLRFTSELSIDEIAKVLDKKLSATKMAFYRALDKFKQLHEKHCT